MEASNQSRRPSFESSCQNKRKLGERNAHLAARIINDRQDRPVHAYSCSYCTGYHVGADDPPDLDNLEKIPEPEPTDMTLEQLQQWSLTARGLGRTSVEKACDEAEVIDFTNSQEPDEAYRRAG